MAVGPGVDVAFSSPTPIGHMDRVWWAGVAYSPKAPGWSVGVWTPCLCQELPELEPSSEVEVGLLGLPRQNIEPSSLQEKLHVDLTGQGSRGKRHRGKAESPETSHCMAGPPLEAECPLWRQLRHGMPQQRARRTPRSTQRAAQSHAKARGLYGGGAIADV